MSILKNRNFVCWSKFSVVETYEGGGGGFNVNLICREITAHIMDRRSQKAILMLLFLLKLPHNIYIALDFCYLAIP